MTKHLFLAGFGPGISTAVAERFGRDGYAVSLVGRNADRIAAGASALAAKGIKAHAVREDLSTPEGVRAAVDKARAAAGPISIVQWSAYQSGAGDLLTATPADLRAVLEVGVVSLSAAVQATHADLKAAKGAVLVTNGGLGYLDPQMDQIGVQFGAMGLSVVNAAKRKLVALLATKLRTDGIYVAEVVVTGTVRGSAFDRGNATIEASAVADKFWELAQARKETSVKI